MPLHLKSKQEYNKYLKNLAKKNEPKKLLKDNDKLIELIKRYMGMTNALMEEVMTMKFNQKYDNER